MTLAIFPAIPGKGWGITKTPVFSTRVLTAASGVEYRAQNWSYPRWRFSIPIQFLRQYGSFVEYNTVVGFCNSRYGQFQNFAYSDPYDNSVTDQALGTGTGSQTAYPLVRALGGFTEPVLAVNTITNVKINGTPTAAYTLGSTYGYANDTINFNSAPANGAVLTSTFTFYFVCRFLQDDPEFSNFIANRWEMRKLDFESVK